MKKYIPYRLKLAYKLFKRKSADRKNKTLLFASKNEKAKKDFPFSFSTKQVIRKSHLYENKIHNLKVGKEKIEQYLIQPNETFSFWEALGKPNEKNGYKKGRNIINGVLSEDIGGGLCQLSGIIFHTSLLAGLEITERFNHTVDIYKEEERLSPLGTDATVVYGYKDLRIKNNLSFPICFSFDITDENITCKINSPQEITLKELVLNRKDEKTRKVTLSYKGDSRVISSSNYLLPK